MRLPLLLLALLAAPLRAQDGGGPAVLPRDEITPQDRAAIEAMLGAQRAVLGLPAPAEAAKTGAAVRFAWPVAKAASVSDPGAWGIVNYVDQDRSSGTQDFACTARTYDGHQGTDISTWPFPMQRMDNNEVLAVAAAPGVILSKRDGNYDRQCVWQSNVTWNAVYIQHDDGSVAWYGHLKSGSLTAKAAGARVAAGEVLGVVGSSGMSSGPHLHFEVYDPAGRLVDPFAGACNGLNGQTSWWIEQPPARVPMLLALRTGAAAPVVNTCPNPEQVNERRVFQPGETLVASAYFRDQDPGQRVDYRLVQPDGSTAQAWSQTMSVSYALSYWYFTRALPASAPTGQWRLEATFQGQTVSRAFAVGTPLAGESGPQGAERRVGAVYPNPFGNTAALDVSTTPGETVVVDALDLLGRRVARLHEGPVPASGTLAFDTHGLAPGLYALRVETARGSVTRLGVRR